MDMFKFLVRYLGEQILMALRKKTYCVLSKTQKLHRYSQQIFLDYIVSFMESSIRNLNSKTLQLSKKQINWEDIPGWINTWHREQPKIEERYFTHKQHTYIQSKNKLLSLWRNSRWEDIGHTHLILNLSTTHLKQYESEVLKFGLKFAKGLRIKKMNYLSS